MADPAKDCSITLDVAYTERLNQKVRARYGGDAKRAATHQSDLLSCLRKAWGKRVVPVEDWLALDHQDDPVLTWAQGIWWEDFAGGGQEQKREAFCFKCQAVSKVIILPGKQEQTNCPVCGERWLLATPDFIEDDLIHEAKQTKKSQRAGPVDAPWWIEQLAGYIMIARKRGGSAAIMQQGRLAVNWLMGTYGDKRKGKRPKPPQSIIEGFLVKFPESDDWWREWELELQRRKSIIEGDDMPPLSFPGSSILDSPKYDWECAGCPVGRALGCENFIWDDDDNLIVADIGADDGTNDKHYLDD
jgi:hypothetical protein